MNIKIFTILMVFGLVSFSFRNGRRMEFHKAFTIKERFPTTYTWSKWYKPDSAKVWKIESAMSAVGSVAAVEINEMRVNFQVNGNHYPLWLGETDSIRFGGDNGTGLILSVLEFNVIDE